MNSRQKEVIQQSLEDEKAVLSALQQNYTKALADIKRNIKELQSNPLTQSKAYQLEFQKMLERQISGIIDNLSGSNFATIADYLNTCYQTGFIGAMYDMQGQGIPLILPISQEQVLKAVQKTGDDIKLANKLGVSTKELKTQVLDELQRGFATDLTYTEIARNISNRGQANLARSMTIARTEGHRVQSEAKMDSYHAAKAKGADIVKQWDATLDGATRDSHRKLDGQIRELDEDFTVDGMSAPYPGGFGDPAEDCNCRCCLLQRARWAVEKVDPDTGEITGEGAYQKWNNETGGFIQCTGYDDFKEKYLKAVDDLTKQSESDTMKPASKGQARELSTSDFGSTFTGKKSEERNTQELVDFINSCEGADPNVVELYGSIGKLDDLSENGVKVSVGHGANNAVRPSYNSYTGDLAECKVTVPKLDGDDITGQAITTLHEDMHYIDLLCGDRTYSGGLYSATDQGLVEAFKQTSSDISADTRSLFDAFHSECQTIRERAEEVFRETAARISAEYEEQKKINWASAFKQYKSEIDSARKIFAETIDYESRNAMGGGIGSLEDIFDALSGGSFCDSGVVLYGHGSSYYRNIDSRIEETIANYGALSVARPDLIDVLRSEKPELVDALDAAVKEMLKKVGG